jgi:hypothetical protein
VIVVIVASDVLDHLTIRGSEARGGWLPSSLERLRRVPPFPDLIYLRKAIPAPVELKSHKSLWSNQLGMENKQQIIAFRRSWAVELH